MQKVRYQQHRRDRVRFALLILAEDRRRRSSDRVLRTKRAYLFFVAGLAVWIGFMLTSHAYGLELSDTPLDIQVQAPPPNVMIVWDNSEHMDWEVLTDEDKGAFSGCGYIFPEHPHGAQAGHVLLLSEIQRRLWLSQWGGYNRLYYRPDILCK